MPTKNRALPPVWRWAKFPRQPVRSASANPTERQRARRGRPDGGRTTQGGVEFPSSSLSVVRTPGEPCAGAWARGFLFEGPPAGRLSPAKETELPRWVGAQSEPEPWDCLRLRASIDQQPQASGSRLLFRRNLLHIAPVLYAR